MVAKGIWHSTYGAAAPVPDMRGKKNRAYFQATGPVFTDIGRQLAVAWDERLQSNDVSVVARLIDSGLERARDAFERTFPDDPR